jgi:hypothetical protein
MAHEDSMKNLGIITDRVVNLGGSAEPQSYPQPRQRTHRNRFSRFLLRLGLGLICVWGLLLGAPATFGQVKPDPEKETKIAALNKEMEQAIEQVKKIINQPVLRYARGPGLKVTVYSPGWFHEGAMKPDFNKVDVRQTQEFNYDPHPYVTSDLTPGVVFKGTDLEFNAMTKYFYTDRSVPKKKLTQPEMLEINRLYRTIGKCETELAALTTPPEERLDAATNETESAPVHEPIPKGNYIKAAIGIAIVLGLYFLYRILRR